MTLQNQREYLYWCDRNEDAFLQACEPKLDKYVNSLSSSIILRCCFVYVDFLRYSKSLDCTAKGGGLLHEETWSHGKRGFAG